MADTNKVTLVNQPDVEREVGEAELLDLTRWGLVATLDGKPFKADEETPKKSAADKKEN